jgi:RNA polymerase sigma-70 factor, ECF subfamily
MERLELRELCNDEEVEQRCRRMPLDRAKWDQCSDEELVGRIRAGDTPLYEALMRRYNQRIYRAALAIVRNDSEAEDVMQEAYVRAFQHLEQFAGEAKFSTWLTKIAVYEAISRVRRQARMGKSNSTPNASVNNMDTISTDQRDPEAQAYDRELKLVLERAIGALPEKYRSVFVLRVVEGLDANETAAALEITVESVKTRLHRGRALLRKELERRAGAVAPEIFPFHLSRCDRVVENVFRRITVNR